MPLPGVEGASGRLFVYGLAGSVPEGSANVEKSLGARFVGVAIGDETLTCVLASTAGNGFATTGELIRDDPELVEKRLMPPLALLDVTDEPIYVYHEIVHNRHVVKRLRDRGAVFVETIDEIPENAIVVFQE